VLVGGNQGRDIAFNASPLTRAETLKPSILNGQSPEAAARAAGGGRSVQLLQTC
tara:strand:+ start:1522 stop:1683 length:162 start_codon:yes stop_codon:yes gene_type:complete